MALNPEPTTAVAPKRRRRRLFGRFETILAVVVVLGLLQMMSLLMPPYLAPNVPAIGRALLELVTEDTAAIVATARRFLLALLFSMALGWFIGLLMAAVPVVGRYLEPYFAIIMATPALSWILIAVLWMRNVELRIFFVVAIIAIPFYVINTFEGVRSIEREVVQGTRQFRPSRWQELWIVLVPYSVQYVLITTRSVAGFTMRILVFAELIGASSGIGSSMNFAQNNFRMDQVFAWTIILIVFNFVLLAVLDFATRRAMRWRPDGLAS